MRKTVLAAVTAALMLMMVGCASFDFGPTGGYVITAREALKDDSAVLVDVRPAEEYALSHVRGAVNIPMASLVVNEPYPNMLPGVDVVEAVMGAAGITQDDTLYLYDSANNMQAARVQWTLNMYGNDNIRVISGGLKALKEAGAEMTSEATALPAAAYTAGEYRKASIVTLDYLKSIINMPDEKTVIIDTRSDEEYTAGTIPGSVHIEYLWNNYPNGEYKTPRDIQNTYLNKKIYPDMRIILFCKTSVRAAQTYTALRDAGYRDVRIYDGAFEEFAAVENPQVPVGPEIPSGQDAS